VFCASMADVFDDAPGLDAEREKLWQLIFYTRGGLDWLLLTKRPENLRRFLPGDWRADAFPNVWLGTTVEDADAMWRIDVLQRVPAAVHFVSAEPLIGPWRRRLDGIDWLIVGGESGPKARPMDVDWARSLHNECRASGTAFLMKQLGGTRDKRDRPEEFPPDLRVREWPKCKPPTAPGAATTADGTATPTPSLPKDPP
jgi:protein gp37